MREPSADDAAVTLLKLLRLVCLGALLTPAAVLFVCAILQVLNEKAGWLRYPLSPVFLVVYLLAGLASPLIGAGSLLLLAIRRRVFREGARGERVRLRKQIVVLSILDILAVLFWAAQFPYVIFSAGGTR